LHEKEKGVTELIVASTAGITSYDPKDGSENWDWTWKFDAAPLRTVSSPLLVDGLVIAGGGEGKGARHTVAVKLGGKGDVTKSNLAWEDKTSDFPYVPSLLASRDNIYFVNDNGVAFCRSAKDGKEVWNHRLNGEFSSSPILIDGKIYAVSEDGVTHVFEASTTYKSLAKNSLGEPVKASPAVADNKLYLRAKNHLYCIGAKK
jgi:outer membrane protein assembly factor BamB